MLLRTISLTIKHYYFINNIWHLYEIEGRDSLPKLKSRSFLFHVISNNVIFWKLKTMPWNVLVGQVPPCPYDQPLMVLFILQGRSLRKISKGGSSNIAHVKRHHHLARGVCTIWKSQGGQLPPLSPGRLRLCIMDSSFLEDIWYYCKFTDTDGNVFIGYRFVSLQKVNVFERTISDN